MEVIDLNRRYQDQRTTTTGSAMQKKNQLAVGTQARILYQDCMGRVNIAPPSSMN